MELIICPSDLYTNYYYVAFDTPKIPKKNVLI